MGLFKREDLHRLYNKLCWLWPVISPPQEYIEETEFFSKLISSHDSLKVKTLLHLGCGGGHNDFTFKKYFKLTGIDISKNMLKLARTLNPEAFYYKGDMRSIRLNKQFDAVIILDSIIAMCTEEDLRKAFLTAYAHLKTQGVFLTLAEIQSDNFRQNRTECRTCTTDGKDIVFIENSFDPDPQDTEFEETLIFLIRKKGKLSIHIDRSKGGVFDIETWHRHLNEVGFEVKKMEFTHSSFDSGHSLPLFICTKRE